MKFYSNLIIPYCIDLSMSGENLQKYRQELLSDVSGEILEIGFGTGLNLPHYPATVDKITAIDANPGMQRVAKSRIEKSQITVNYKLANGENIPLEDYSFDSVVCTWTLCSVAQVELAIAEIYRLLKPAGKFFFIEHGLSKDSSVQFWQNTLTPIQKVVADGCHLNRQISDIVKQKFTNVTIDQFYDSQLPKAIGYMYRGVAVK